MNQQIVIYVFARVVLALAKLAVQPPGDNSLVGGSYGGRGGKGMVGLNEEQMRLAREYSWPVFASLSWAGVMWLFRWYPETLQPSLRSSMTYMYVFSRVLSPSVGPASDLFLFSDIRMRRNGMGSGILRGITNEEEDDCTACASMGLGCWAQRRRSSGSYCWHISYIADSAPLYRTATARLHNAHLATY